MCPESEALIKEDTYIKWFGGECEVVYDCHRFQYHIHIRNDDIGYICFHMSKMTLKTCKPHLILEMFSRDYLAHMKIHVNSEYFKKCGGKFCNKIFMEV